MLPTIAQVSSLGAAFETDVAEFSAAAARSIEIWLGKLETYLDKHSVADAKRLLAEQEVAAPVASFQGGLLTSQGDFRRAHWESFSRRLALCRELDIGVLVVAADIGEPLGSQEVERARASLAQIAREAEGCAVRVALEFQARSALVNNLETAIAVISEVNSPWLGVCLDLFHFATGPSKTEDLALLTRDNLFHVQLSDLSGVARELALDADRILPGDGDLAPWIELLVARMREIDYTGAVSIELMNPMIWQVPPRQFAEVAMTAKEDSGPGEHGVIVSTYY